MNKYKWEKYYELATIYYNFYGNLNIDENFKTINGYEYNENGINLGMWLFYQKKFQKRLSSLRKQKLININMDFKTLNDIKWNEMYSLAKSYYEKYHNLKINCEFKTINGYEYDETGKNLGKWIATQRINRKNLSEEKIKLLNNIDMIWKINKKNQAEKIYICEKYNIDFKANESILICIPLEEFKAKINYLQFFDLPIAINGILNELFFLSDSDLYLRYGIVLEDLILKYYINIDEKQYMNKTLKKVLK